MTKIPTPELLAYVHRGLDKRTRHIFEMRFAGLTLQEIGNQLGVTRERVRQIEKLGKASMSQLVSALGSLTHDELSNIKGKSGTVSPCNVEDIFGGDHPYLAAAVIESLGFVRCKVWGQDVAGWWVEDAAAFQELLNEMLMDAPFSNTELIGRARDVGIQSQFPIEKVAAFTGSGVEQDINGNWVRLRSKGADSAYLWLSARAEPSDALDICEGIGAVSGRAIAEAMRRDKARFVQVRPEGTWAIRSWSSIDGTSYSNATDAVLAVLKDEGPLTWRQLSVATMRRYPVSQSRIDQCRFSERLGETSDGRYDLIERGCAPLDLPIPPRPENMAESGASVAVRLRVNAELLRGSGVGVNSWLAWRVGLKYYPSQRSFSTRGETGSDAVTIRRHSSGASISSLRGFALRHGLESGCILAVVFDLGTLTANLIHACGSPCPALRTDGI